MFSDLLPDLRQAPRGLDREARSLYTVILRARDSRGIESFTSVRWWNESSREGRADSKTISIIHTSELNGCPNMPAQRFCQHACPEALPAGSACLPRGSASSPRGSASWFSMPAQRLFSMPAQRLCHMPAQRLCQLVPHARPEALPAGSPCPPRGSASWFPMPAQRLCQLVPHARPEALPAGSSCPPRGSASWLLCQQCVTTYFVACSGDPWSSGCQ